MGIPLAGSDICGFIFSTTPELCARWHILGAFYPFSRNHNNRGDMPQEPYQPWFANANYIGTTSYTDIMRLGILTKYHMIRYYYTELSLLSENGGAFYKPMFFEFPEDSQAYLDQPENVMLGKALKLSVQTTVLGDVRNETEFYFPAGTWCNVFIDNNGTDSCKKYDQPSIEKLRTLAYDYYLHLREGYVVPMQDTFNLNFSTSADLQKEPVDLYIHTTNDAGTL
jgi:alpha-glucosidase (family GH31 glycosyl hydrolase)